MFSDFGMMCVRCVIKYPQKAHAFLSIGQFPKGHRCSLLLTVQTYLIVTVYLSFNTRGINISVPLTTRTAKDRVQWYHASWLKTQSGRTAQRTGHSALLQRTLYEWTDTFNNGPKSVTDEVRWGRQWTSTGSVLISSVHLLTSHSFSTQHSNHGMHVIWEAAILTTPVVKGKWTVKSKYQYVIAKIWKFRAYGSARIGQWEQSEKRDTNNVRVQLDVPPPPSLYTKYEVFWGLNYCSRA